ncbi:MAG: dipeptidase [Nitrososphaerota archaeon]|nr:dipeptidase [Nitrososphaerota archaeon]
MANVTQSPSVLAQKWVEIHQKATLVDCHTDIVLELYGEIDQFGMRQNFKRLGEKSVNGQVDIPRMKEGGVDCQVFAIWSDPARTYDPMRRALELLECLTTEIEQNRSTIGLATSYGDIESLQKQGKIAALISLEGAEPLAGKMAMLRIFYRLGVRLLGLTWSFRNELGFGSRESTSYGLTDLGFNVVKEANSLGVLLDVSHLNKQGFYDLAGVTSKPFIASHSNARAVYDHRRNLDDQQIKMIADHGGAIGVVFVPMFLSDGQATLDTVCKHIMHMTKLVGSEYVGLGSDFPRRNGTPIGLEDFSKLPSLTRKLLELGLSQNDVENILGNSMLRVFKEVLK